MSLFGKLSQFKVAKYAAVAPQAAGWALKGQLRSRVRAMRSYRLVAESGLFDPAYYVAQPGYREKRGLDPVQHYLLFGSTDNLDPNPLFDTSWYLTQNPDVNATGINPLVHFSSSGWREKRNPHPLFDVSWYLEHNPDVAQAGINPLHHFLSTGGKEARSPHALFDSKWYFAKNPDVAEAQVNLLIHYLANGWRENRNPHPLFHTRFYLEQTPELLTEGISPLEHFVIRGFRNDLNPNHLFDTAYYRRLYPDITAEVNPLMHYLFSGGREFRSPHPLFDPLEYSRRVPRLSEHAASPLEHYFRSGILQRLSPHLLFDSPFYLSQRPDLAGTGVDPVLDYFEHGNKLGLDPCELFNTSYYLTRYPEVQRTNQNALVHFVTHGALQGYNPNPLFDSAYYLKQNGDVAALGENPLVHYLHTGAFEGRSPSPFFDSAFYLRKYPAVRQARINPLTHYLVRGGAEEGKDPNSFFKTAVYRKEHPDVAEFGMNPLVHFIGGYPEIQIATDASERAVQQDLHLRHRRLRRRSDRNRPAESKATVICVSHVCPIPSRAGNEYRILRMLEWLVQSGYEAIPVLSPLPQQIITDGQLAEVADRLGNAVLCLRDGTVVSEAGEEIGRILDALDSCEALPRLASYPSVDLTPREAELLGIECTFCHDALLQLVSALTAGKTDCVVFAEYVFMSRLLAMLPENVLKVIDTHDVFSSKQKKVVARGVADGLALSDEEEAAMLARADLIMAIQPEEQAALERLIGPDTRVLVAGVDFPVVRSSNSASGQKVLFIGSDNRMNAQGLRDFLRFAWPWVLRDAPKAELLVAGKVCQTIRTNAPGVHLLGAVESIEGLYRDAKAVINPALAGTGLKVKTLEALSYLRPLVTWPTGIDGLHPDLRKMCLVATDWFEFSDKLVGVLNSSRAQWFTDEQIRELQVKLSADSVYRDLYAVLEEWVLLHEVAHS